MIVHRDDVRRGALLQDPEGFVEIEGGDLPVVRKQHLHVLGKADVRIRRLVPLDQDEGLQGLEHVVEIGIRSHADRDAAMQQLKSRRHADRIVHVRLGVVDDHGPRLPDAVHLPGAYVDAVGKECLRSEDPVVGEALDRMAAVVSNAVIHVVHALAHMDVESRPPRIRLDHLLKGGVRDRKEGMPAKHRRKHARTILFCPVDEVRVLLNGRPALVHAIPLGDLITEARPLSHLLTDIADGKEGSLDRPEARVVVKDRRYPVPYALKKRCIRTGFCLRNREMPVNRPPGALENVNKRLRVISRNRKTAGKSRVDVRVAVDKPRENESPMGIDKGSTRSQQRKLRFLSDRLDHRSVDQHRTAFNERVFVIHRDHGSVSDKDHRTPPVLFLSCRLHVLTPLSYRIPGQSAEKKSEVLKK